MLDAAGRPTASRAVELQARPSEVGRLTLTVKQTLQTWTVLETVLSVVSFAVAGLLFVLLA